MPLVDQYRTDEWLRWYNMPTSEPRVQYHLVESSEIDSHNHVPIRAKPSTIFKFFHTEPLTFWFLLERFERSTQNIQRKVHANGCPFSRWGSFDYMPRRGCVNPSN